LKRLIYTSLLIIYPFITKAIDTASTQDSLGWSSSINMESNSLNMDFASRMLFGGYIHESQKNSWISKLDENNTLFSEV
jgi:hypothetical protein